VAVAEQLLHRAGVRADVSSYLLFLLVMILPPGRPSWSRKGEAALGIND